MEDIPESPAASLYVTPKHPGQMIKTAQIVKVMTHSVEDTDTATV